MVATDGVNAIVNGLKHAKEKGWDTPEKSIKEIEKEELRKIEIK